MGLFLTFLVSQEHPCFIAGSLARLNLKAALSWHVTTGIEGARDGELVGEPMGAFDGVADGLMDSVGLFDGWGLIQDGLELGLMLGTLLGLLLGAALGLPDGAPNGAIEGSDDRDGFELGLLVGAAEGALDKVGLDVEQVVHDLTHFVLTVGQYVVVL